uniref:C-type lectin domain-containing protein n=1 Tax=Caenorhabditis tropicalis TaxID=1561998 RepID=A0A1I7V450_9PELO
MLIFTFLVVYVGGKGKGGGHKHGGEGRGEGGSRGNLNRGCPAGWFRSDRPSGGWCIQVFAGRHMQPDAEKICKTHGATLSGLQSAAEIQKVTDAALKVIGFPAGALWIGGARRANCMLTGINSACTYTNSFVWTDVSASGTEGFIWQTKQPDNAHYKQPCIALLASSTPITDYQTWYNGRLDDLTCYLPNDLATQRALRGFVCGKRAAI